MFVFITQLQFFFFLFEKSKKRAVNRGPHIDFTLC